MRLNPNRFLLNPFLIILSVILAYFLATIVGSAHCAITRECSASVPSIGFTPYIGFIISYIFFVSALLVALGNRGKFLWLVVLIGPILLWPVYEAASSVAFEFFAAAVAGILVGILANKILTQLAPSLMSKIS